ncbi:MAG: T9SS type A sorting domain-containing protein, partial [Bacteroidales bacterium]|nr:T9SS type A sorting domain-containing protein [Bacteroidales bacterium]
STSFTTVSVGIDRVAEAGCTIYPNPTSGATTIRITGITGKVKISVVNMNGREVVVATNGSNGTLGGEALECSGDCAKSLDVERLAQGAYFVRITGENVSMVRKLIVR